MIPKPESAGGGVRPIALLSSVYRIWAVARVEVARRWEKENHRFYFSAAKGSSALDLAWKQGLDSELAGALGAHMLSVFLDISKFYDNILLGRLLKELLRWGFPVRMSVLVIKMYAGMRHLLFSGSVGVGCSFLQGVLAGCTFATTMVKVYVISSYDALVSRHSAVSNSLRLFVDVTSASWRGF
jgi:hypothetical protein